MTVLVLKTIKQVKRFIIGVIGFTILLIGVAMIVLPGPAFVVIPIGLGVLATEYVWARSVLKKIKRKIENYANRNRHDAGT